MNWKRALRHALYLPWLARRQFPAAALSRLGNAVATSEQTHRGEIRLIIEGALPPWAVLCGLQPRQRALALFAQHHVWDTEDNTGILLYLLLAERRIEIVADRGIARRVAQSEWDGVCRDMEQAFLREQFIAGLEAGFAALTRLLSTHFPAGRQANPNELPDQPILL